MALPLKPIPGTKLFFQPELDNGNIAIVTPDREPVGIIWWAPSGQSTIHVEHLDISPKYQNRGLGEALLREFAATLPTIYPAARHLSCKPTSQGIVRLMRKVFGPEVRKADLSKLPKRSPADWISTQNRVHLTFRSRPMESVNNLLSEPLRETDEDPLSGIPPEHYLDQIENPDIPVRAQYIVTEDYIVDFECQKWFKQASDEDLLLCNRYQWDERNLATRNGPNELAVWKAVLELFASIVQMMEGEYPELIDADYASNHYPDLVVNATDARNWIRLNRRHLLPQLGEGLDKQTYHVKIGGTYWFEYRCYESDSSSDAVLWYHSHQQCKILKMIERGCGKDIEDRGYNGQPAVYKIQFSDGAVFDATEDEILDDRSEFTRPHPPAPPGHRRDKGAKIVYGPGHGPEVAESDLGLDDPQAMWDRMNEKTDVGAVYELLKANGYNPDLPLLETVCGPNVVNGLGIVCTGHPDDVTKFLMQHNVYNAKLFWSSHPNQERVLIQWPPGAAFFKEDQRPTLCAKTMVEAALDDVDPEHYLEFDWEDYLHKNSFDDNLVGNHRWERAFGSTLLSVSTSYRPLTLLVWHYKRTSAGHWQSASHDLVPTQQLPAYLRPWLGQNH